MFFELTVVAFVVSVTSGQTTNNPAAKLAQLSTLKTRAYLLESTLKREQDIYAKRQREVKELLKNVGSSETTCYKRLQAIEEFMKPANETHCKVDPKKIRTCSDWYRAGYTTNGVYTIDPDGPGGVMPFNVDCQFTTPYNKNDKRHFTIVHHDSEKRGEVGKCKGPQCFTKTINYAASKEQLNALAKASYFCEQKVRYDCFNSRLLKGGYGAWYSHEGVKQNYWGHWLAKADDANKCWCGVNKKCQHNSPTCNCDSGVKAWTNDQGWIRNKNVPITKLAFGDTDGPDKAAFYTLGPLSCRGR